jgi:hypothetical protein
MNIPSNLDLKPITILKILGLAFIAIIVLATGLRFVGSSVQPFLENTSFQGATKQSVGLPAYYSEDAYGVNDVSLSVRNISPSPEPPQDGGSVGGDAEDYETTQYNALIETRNLQYTCGRISELKSFDYVVFENANEYDQGCSYTFKVNKDNSSEVLAVIEELDPRDLSENTRTIKQLVEDYTSETEILENKLLTINTTLEDAVVAYDSITQLATRTQDAASLAKIIDSKLQVIERLTREKINITSELERLNRAKAVQLDRLDYTYFYVNIVENKYIDGQQLKDSWKLALKDSVRDINQAVQDMTVNLIALLFILAQYALYLLIIVIVAKYGWRLARSFWEK